jgi:hypothetical protein
MAEIATIYIALLNEGTDVWKPVTAQHLHDDVFRVIGPMPEDEKWAFPPGAVVMCKRQAFRDGSQGSVAVALAD